MHYSTVIIASLILSACAVSNASNLILKADDYRESLQCPANICINIHTDSKIYRGTHILQPNNINIEDAMTRF